ncbi:hypothetical protein U3A58_13995 [Algoriphagus sp. C2-6-M1]|nr:hypothetical protein [Algoriphagus sp. C2-6-M1]MEB2781508.1 hypothetical protein [Algoriphagus sp. C2-6-M1]
MLKFQEELARSVLENGSAWWRKSRFVTFQSFIPIPLQQINANPNLRQNP